MEGHVTVPKLEIPILFTNYVTIVIKLLTYPIVQQKHPSYKETLSIQENIPYKNLPNLSMFNTSCPKDQNVIKQDNIYN